MSAEPCVHRGVTEEVHLVPRSDGRVVVCCATHGLRAAQADGEVAAQRIAEVHADGFHFQAWGQR